MLLRSPLTLPTVWLTEDSRQKERKTSRNKGPICMEIARLAPITLRLSACLSLSLQLCNYHNYCMFLTRNKNWVTWALQVPEQHGGIFYYLQLLFDTGKVKHCDFQSYDGPKWVNKLVLKMTCIVLAQLKFPLNWLFICSWSGNQELI